MTMEFTIEDSVRILARTPATLQALLADLPEPWVRNNEGAETFSPFDVVGHLIDGEETDWIVRAELILRRGPDLTFAPYDRFRHQVRNAGRSLASLLDEFATLRAANLEKVRGWKLTPEQLALPGMHPRLGPVTLRHLLSAWVVHDLGHTAQVVRVMAKQYGTEVGPWVAFLPVLTDHPAPRS